MKLVSSDSLIEENSVVLCDGVSTISFPTMSFNAECYNMEAKSNNSLSFKIAGNSDDIIDLCD